MSQLGARAWLFMGLAAFLIAALAIHNARAEDLADDSLAEHGGGGSLSFSISGKIKVSSSTCGSNSCFKFKGAGTDQKGKPFTVTGNGQLDEASCQPNSTGTATCCQVNGSEIFKPNKGTVDASFTGTACEKKGSKTEKVSASVTVTGGTGIYSGATGTASETLTDNTKTGKGTLTASGTLQ